MNVFGEYTVPFFVRAIWNFDVFELAARESARTIPILHFGLQAPNHHRTDEHRVGSRSPGEAIRIEEFEERTKAVAVTVVRGRC